MPVLAGGTPMHRKTIVSLLAASSLGFATPSLAQHVGHGPPAPPSTLSGWAQGAKLYDGLGTFHRKITTQFAGSAALFRPGHALRLGVQP